MAQIGDRLSWLWCSCAIGCWRRFEPKIRPPLWRSSIASMAKSKTASRSAAMTASRSAYNPSMSTNSLMRNSGLMKRSSVKAPHRDLTIEEIEREWARRQLVRFTTHTFPDYRAGWFHRVVAAEADQFLAAVAARQSPGLILTAPPQHGKSELISRRLPAFALGRNPDLKIIATSYSADRALDFSGDVQRIMDSESYHVLFPDTRTVGQFAKIGEAKRTAALFEVVGRRGRYRAAGIGGGITGEPADILIVDDPIKDFSEAISDTIRESVWNWLTSTAMTRLQEGGGVIVMATRWHLDDPIGRLLERQPGDWKLINFRAIAEEDEPPYRFADEPLSVERFGLDSLIQIRDGGAMSSYQWAALYQHHRHPWVAASSNATTGDSTNRPNLTSMKSSKAGTAPSRTRAAPTMSWVRCGVAKPPINSSSIRCGDISASAPPSLPCAH